MLARDRLKVDFYLTRKKVLANKGTFIPTLVIAFFIAYVWVKDSYSIGLKFFVYLFPHIFLFFSQDMMKDEVESGGLENILFLEGRFKQYLWTKNFCLYLVAAGVAGSAMAALGIYGLAAGEFSGKCFGQFGMGLVAGAYYIALGGWLSFYFKGGSNVLILILGQLSLFIGLLFSVAQRSGFLDYLESGAFPDWVSRVKFLIFLGLFPNILASEKHFIYSFGVALAAGFWLILQQAKLRSLDLKRQ